MDALLGLKAGAELLGAPRYLVEPALGSLLDPAQAAELGDLPGEPRLLGLFEAFLLLTADEHFRHVHERPLRRVRPGGTGVVPGNTWPAFARHAGKPPARTASCAWEK